MRLHLWFTYRWFVAFAFTFALRYTLYRLTLVTFAFATFVFFTVDYRRTRSLFCLRTHWLPFCVLRLLRSLGYVVTTRLPDSFSHAHTTRFAAPRLRFDYVCVSPFVVLLPLLIFTFVYARGYVPVALLRLIVRCTPVLRLITVPAVTFFFYIVWLVWLRIRSLLLFGLFCVAVRFALITFRALRLFSFVTF